MSSLRLFAALELPGEVRAALVSWGALVSAREPALRLVRADALHATLVFLGEQPDSELVAIGRAVVSHVRSLDPLQVGAAAWLPAHRPDVLVARLGEEGDRLAKLQADLGAALSAWHAPETRDYLPHVTVARVRRGERISRAAMAAPPRLVFAPVALALYRSFAQRGGSRYEAVARVPL